MKIILNGFYNKSIIPIVQNIFKKIDCDFAGIMYTFEKFEVPHGIKTTWLPYAKFFKHGDYPIDTNTLLPLDKELIAAMSKCETIVLKMMDRFETIIPFTYMQRKQAYLKHLRFWNDFLETNKIDLFISANIPHEVFDYVLYYLCKLKKIQTLCLYQVGQINDTVAVITDINNAYEAIGNHYHNLLQTHENSLSDDIILSKNTSQYYLSQTSREKNPVPMWVSDKKLIAKIMGRNKKLINYLKNVYTLFREDKKTIFGRMVNPLFWLRKIYRAILSFFTVILQYLISKYVLAYYVRHTKDPDFSQKYIYFALHYQPEATTSPMAGSFVEQQLIVQMIARYLPPDYKLYVKEHPQQTFRSRNIKFYRDLLSIKNLWLIPKHISTYELIKHSTAVATATGTVGWEALFKLKPILMFGEYIYKYAPGVFYIQTNKDCEKAIKNITEKKYILSHQHLKLYLKAIEKNTINGYVNIYYAKTTSLTPEENIQNISTAIIQKIEEIQQASN
jgi:hypothetical protein